MSFNTTIVSVEQRYADDGVTLGDMLFQYNYCFGGTKQAENFPDTAAGFNTTIVSVEQTRFHHN